MTMSERVILPIRAPSYAYLRVTSLPSTPVYRYQP